MTTTNGIECPTAQLKCESSNPALEGGTKQLNMSSSTKNVKGNRMVIKCEVCAPEFTFKLPNELDIKDKSVVEDYEIFSCGDEIKLKIIFVNDPKPMIIDSRFRCTFALDDVWDPIFRNIRLCEAEDDEYVTDDEEEEEIVETVELEIVEIVSDEEIKEEKKQKAKDERMKIWEEEKAEKKKMKQLEKKKKKEEKKKKEIVKCRDCDYSWGTKEQFELGKGRVAFSAPTVGIEGEDKVCCVCEEDKVEEKTDVELMGEALGKLSFKMNNMPQGFHDEMNELFQEEEEEEKVEKKKRKDMKKRKYTIEELTENGMLVLKGKKQDKVDKRCKAWKRGYVDEAGKLLE